MWGREARARRELSVGTKVDLLRSMAARRTLGSMFTIDSVKVGKAIRLVFYHLIAYFFNIFKNLTLPFCFR